MKVIVDNKGDVIVLTLVGNLLGESDSETISKTVTDALENNKNKFIFDVEKLGYVNSTGLSMLIGSLTKSRKAEGDLILVNIQPQLLSLLTITKLNKVFTNNDSIESALETFKNK